MDVPINILSSGSYCCPSKTIKRKKRGAKPHCIALHKANLSAKTEESKTPFSPFALVLRDPTPPA